MRAEYDFSKGICGVYIDRVMYKVTPVLRTLREVLATRYALPLREGGSLPALVEANDDGMYVVKFRGAGQGVKAIVADIYPALGRNYPDEEIRDLLKASPGRNLGMDFLPGSTMFEAAAGDCATE